MSYNMLGSKSVVEYALLAVCFRLGRRLIAQWKQKVKANHISPARKNNVIISPLPSSLYEIETYELK
jgi:hypothetical protein